MAHQLKEESNLCSQDNVDSCNITNRSSKRKITQITEQNNVNKKAKICEENTIGIIQCNEFQEKTCKYDNVDLLAENIPILVDNSNVLENNCTNIHKNNKQEKIILKSKPNVLQNFHQCKYCSRSFRSAQTLTVHCNFQHKDKLDTNEASVSSVESNVINTRSSTNRPNVHCNIDEPVKSEIGMKNDVGHANVLHSNVELNKSCNNDNTIVNCKEVNKVVTNAAKTQHKNSSENKVALHNSQCVKKKDVKVLSNQQKNTLQTKIRNLNSNIFCTEMKNQYFCSVCGLMFLHKTDASVHKNTNHSEVKNTTKVITKTKRIIKCKRNGKHCIVHKSLYFKKSILAEKCKKKSKIVFAQRFYCTCCKLHFSQQHLCTAHLNQVHGIHNLDKIANIKSNLVVSYMCYKCHGLFRPRKKLKNHLSRCSSSVKSQDKKFTSAMIISDENTKNQKMETEVMKLQVSKTSDTSLVRMEQASVSSTTMVNSTHVTSQLKARLQGPDEQVIQAGDGLISEGNVNSTSLQLNTSANPQVQSGFQGQAVYPPINASSNSINSTSSASLCITYVENLSDNCSNNNAEQYLMSLTNTVDLNIFQINLGTTYFCVICNLAHKSKIDVLEHLNAYHPQSLHSITQTPVTKAISFICKLCSMKQYSVIDCSKHVETCCKNQTNSNVVYVDRFHCTNCELHFAMRHHCIRHMYTSHNIKVSEHTNIFSKVTMMYKCHTCLKIYQGMVALNNHTCQIVATKKNSPYSSTEVLHHFCPLCDQHFPGINSCQRHISLTHPEENNSENNLNKKIVSKMCVIWICHICSTLRTKHFDSKEELSDHMVTHNIKLSLTAENINEVVYTDTKKSQNKVSLKRTKQKSSVKKGKKKKKKNDSDYETTDDSEDYEQIFGLNPDEDSQNSLTIADSDEVNYTNYFLLATNVEYPCPFCNSEYVTEDATLQHIQQDHSDVSYNKIEIVPQNRQMFTCKACDTIVYSNEECNQHHSVCTSSNLENKIVEVKIKRIHCSFCPQHFAMRHHCIRHMCKVHAVKSKMHMELTSKLTTMYKCPKCMKLYHSIESLQSHITRCTIAFHKHKSTYSKIEDELYFCPLCPQYFTSMYLCRRHMNLVHTDARVPSKKIVSKVCVVWICLICSSLRKKYFDSKESLNEHMVKHKIQINEDIEETCSVLEGTRNLSDENNSNDTFALQDTTKTCLTEDYSKLPFNVSESYEPPVFISDLPANNLYTQSNGIDVTQSQYIENVSMDFYSTNLANVSGQNLPIQQNSTFEQTQACEANLGQENKETNTESLLYGFQILNSMSTTTDSELPYDKQLDQSHLSTIDCGLSKCLTPMQNLSPTYIPQPLPHLNTQYSQQYLNSFNYGSNAQYSSLDYSATNVSLDVTSNVAPMSNNHNFYLYPEYANSSSLVYSKDDMLHNIKPELPPLAATNNQNVYPIVNYSNPPQYSSTPQYAATNNIPTHEQNYQEFNANNTAHYTDESLLQENSCSIQVIRSHCPYCILHFSKQHDCVYHIRNTHTTDLQAFNNIVSIPTTMYKCHNCNKLCVTMMALQSHVLKCKTTKIKGSYSCCNENRYFCPYCQQHFQNMFLCERHINLVHKEISTFSHNIVSKQHDLWICHICSTLRTKYFDTKELLADHMMVKHFIPIDDMYQDENSSNVKVNETTELPSFCSTENSMQSIGENSYLQMQESSHCEDFQNVSNQQYQIKEEFITNNQIMQQTLQPPYLSSENTLFQATNTEQIYQRGKTQQDLLCQTSAIPNYTTETFSVYSENTRLSYANSESHDTESNHDFSVKQEDTSTQMSTRSEDYDSSATPSSEFKSAEKNSEDLWTVEVLRTHCNICMLHFSNPQNCMNHIKASHKFATSPSELIHTKLTTMYKCDKCSKICVAKAAVKHHISICKIIKNEKEDAYSKVDGIRYFCPECQQHFSSVAMCRRHININHENAEILFESIAKKSCDLWVCQICSTLKTKYFDTKLLLAEHMIRHNIVVDTDNEEVETEENISSNSLLQSHDTNTDPLECGNKEMPQKELQEFQIIQTEENVHSTSGNLENVNYEPTYNVNNVQTLKSEACIDVNYQAQEPVYSNCTPEVNVVNTSEYQMTMPISEKEYLSAEHLENNNPILGDFISSTQSKYTCVSCKKQFDTECSVTEHLKTKHQIDSFNFQNTDIAIKLDMENYTCKACNVLVNSISQCIEHKAKCAANIKNNENEFAVHVKRFYCPICFAHQSQRHHTNRHLMNVHKERNVGKNILHLNTLMYKCNKCSKLHVSMALLTKHMSTCHTSLSENKYSKTTKIIYCCPTCEQHFSCLNYCKKHIKQCHEDADNLTPVQKEQSVWVCNICSSLRAKMFDTKSSLVEHMQTHDVVVEVSDSDSDDDVTQDSNQMKESNNKLDLHLASHSNDTFNSNNVKESKGSKSLKTASEGTRRMTRSSANNNCS